MRETAADDPSAPDTPYLFQTKLTRRNGREEQHLRHNAPEDRRAEVEQASWRMEGVDLVREARVVRGEGHAVAALELAETWVTA